MTDRLEAFATKVHTYLADDSVLMVLGKVTGRQNEQSRRIVWNRSQQQAKAQRADRKSGGQLFNESDPTKATREVQAIDRFETAEVKIYADDAECVDNLWDALLTALDKLTGTIDWQQDGIPYQWMVDEANAQRQPFIAAAVRYRSPVATETKRLVTIRTVINSEQVLTS